MLPRRRIRNLLLLTLFVCGSCVAAISWRVGGQLVSPNKCEVGPIPVGMSGASISLDTDIGMMVKGWHMRSVDATATVILLHPIRGDRRSMLGRLPWLGKAGLFDLVIDLPSQWESRR